VIRRHSKKALSLTDPTDLTPALDAIASLAKLPAAKIVRYLVDHPESFYGQIQEATEIPTASVTRYLQDLEANGIIAGDLPLDARRGRSVRYTVRADYITATLERIRTELLEGRG
jgi:DNA-binding MarR family transcriptional regulator